MRIPIAPGVHLFVDIEGAGLVPEGLAMREKPALVLLHGGPGYDHASFKPAFSRLADLTQIIYYDHRGHGRSDPRPMDEVTLDTLADDVVRLCDALGISKPIVLGQSFGGFVAQRYIARHPAHPAKVILSSTSARLGLTRKLAMFEQLGGPEAREAAERFWRAPSAATYAPYQRICKPLFRGRLPPTAMRPAAPRSTRKSCSPGLDRSSRPWICCPAWRARSARCWCWPAHSIPSARWTMRAISRTPCPGIWCSSRHLTIAATASGATRPMQRLRVCAPSLLSSKRSQNGLRAPGRRRPIVL
jgi:pimeloyl-ACP methyl ester carboxylesterase